MPADMAYSGMSANWSLFIANIEPPITPLGSGAMFPEAVEVKAFISDSRVATIWLRVMDGRPVLVGLCLGPNGDWRGATEISATEVHRLKVDELVRDAIQAVANNVFDATPATMRLYISDPALAGLSARRGKPMTDVALQAVAEIYTNEDNQHAPTKAVAEQLSLSPRQASRYVAAARKRGFIADGPTHSAEETKGEQ